MWTSTSICSRKQDTYHQWLFSADPQYSTQDEYWIHISSSCRYHRSPAEPHTSLNAKTTTHLGSAIGVTWPCRVQNAPGFLTVSQLDDDLTTSNPEQNLPGEERGQSQTLSPEQSLAKWFSLKCVDKHCKVHIWLFPKPWLRCTAVILALFPISIGKRTPLCFQN